MVTDVSGHPTGPTYKGKAVKEKPFCQPKLRNIPKERRPDLQGCWQVLSPTRKETSYILRILWNLEVHYHIHKSPPPVPTLAKSIHSSAQHTFDRRSLFPSWSG